MKKLIIILPLFFLLSGCGGIIVVLLSPSKQKTKDMTTIPKKSDFMYSQLEFEKKCFEKTVAFTSIDNNYVHHDGSIYPVKRSYVFWPNGKCYYMSAYKSTVKIFNEEKFYGKSGYYYLKNDSLFIERFGSNGMGHGYWYYQCAYDGMSELKFDSKKWYYREPKRNKKIKLSPNTQEKEIFNWVYKKDTTTIFNVNPKW